MDELDENYTYQTNKDIYSHFSILKYRGCSFLLCIPSWSNRSKQSNQRKLEYPFYETFPPSHETF